MQAWQGEKHHLPQRGHRLGLLTPQSTNKCWSTKRDKIFLVYADCDHTRYLIENKSAPFIRPVGLRLSTWQRTWTNIYFPSRLSWNDLPTKLIGIIKMPSLTLHYIYDWWFGCAHLLWFFRLLTASHLSPPFLTSFGARVQAPVDPRKFYPSSVCRRPATNGFAMCSEITYLRATATKTSNETYKMAYRQQITLTCIFLGSDPERMRLSLA